MRALVDAGIHKRTPEGRVRGLEKPWQTGLVSKGPPPSTVFGSHRTRQGAPAGVAHFYNPTLTLRPENPLDQFQTFKIISAIDLYLGIWQVALKSKLKTLCETPDQEYEHRFVPFALMTSDAF